jgi:acyl-CoA synthetase (AMP-forming)/AMP-acid ligase II
VQIDEVGEALARLDIHGTDRIAVALPDGPEMAAAFLSISAFAAFAPLNPAYTSEEFEFYLTDLRTKILVLSAGVDSPARAGPGSTASEYLG